MSESPLGGVELTSVVTFGVREAALAGVAVSPAATAGRGGVLFADTSTLVWTMHPTCSGGTLTFTYESYMDRLEYDSE
jgi:hypothetical protein